MSHIRRAIAVNPEIEPALVAAVEARAAKLVSLSGLSPVVIEALTVMASRSLAPAELSEAAADVRSLMATMQRNRVRRLTACGFTARTGRYQSHLHSPNLM
ncbi:MAG: hypothetical protein WAL38_01935 [Solirubrobacteraceae bacterium]